MSHAFSWLRQGGRWIPLCFVGFFLVVVAVNGVLLTLALRTFNGLTTDHAYARGLAYNRVIEAAQIQADLGWRSALAFDADGTQAGRLRLELLDRAGAQVRGARTVARFVRPTAQGHDFEVPLTEIEPGLYAARVELPLPGVWEVRLEASRAADRYAAAERLFVR